MNDTAQPFSRDEAAHALAAAQAAGAQLANISCPPWRHALFGGLFFLLIGSISWSNAAQMAMTPVLLLLIAVIVRSDRKRMGVFVNGYRRGATLPIALTLVAVNAGMVAGAMALREGGYAIVPKLALATAAFVIATLFSIVWQRTYRREHRVVA